MHATVAVEGISLFAVTADQELNSGENVDQCGLGLIAGVGNDLGEELETAVILDNVALFVQVLLFYSIEKR